MLETFTPAVCGSRKRQVLAQALFAGSAVAAAATVGLALGLVGGALGAERAVLVAAAVALVAAAREAGLLRFPLPQARRQVPERWRFELPLPVWATGYGAGLGAGMFTFQPVSTFWVACAAALALARPLPAALCFSLYGAGRAVMVVWPRRRASDPSAAVERLTGRRRTLLRANAIALVVCGILLALAPAAGGARFARAALDPSASGHAVAFARQSGVVVVRPSSGPDVVFRNASQPALSGRYLAYVGSRGIRVVRWRNGELVARLTSHGARRPALAWPRIAYVRRDSNRKRLILRNFETGNVDVIASVRPSTDLGRPSLRHGRLAWPTVSRKRSLIKVLRLWNGARQTVARTRIGRLSAPSLYYRKVIWVDARSGVTRLKQWRIGSSKRRVLATIRSRAVSYWTTSRGPNACYMTRWRIASGAAEIHKRSC
jgi:hypothetical protein